MRRIPYDEAFHDRVRRHLQRFERRRVDDPSLKRASVAVALVEDASGQAAFVLTRRPLSLRRHAGQWALPGGRGDEGETSLETALRELREEVGLRIDPSRHAGTLDDFETRSGFVITPEVFFGPAQPQLTPDPEEVHVAHIVPLALLDAPNLPRIVPAENGPGSLVCFPLDALETTIWAPTAALLFQIREVVLHGRSTRVAHFEQPRFAWE